MRNGGGLVLGGWSDSGDSCLVWRRAVKGWSWAKKELRTVVANGRGQYGWAGISDSLVTESGAESCGASRSCMSLLGEAAVFCEGLVPSCFFKKTGGKFGPYFDWFRKVPFALLLLH